MNLLSQIHRLCNDVFDYYHRDTDDEAKMVAWLKENRVLEQSLKGFLHHPQYCKRLEELIQVVVLRQVAFVFVFSDQC